MNATTTKTGIRLTHNDNKNTVMSGLKNSLTDETILYTAMSLNSFQTQLAKHIFKVETAEMTE